MMYKHKEWVPVTAGKTFKAESPVLLKTAGPATVFLVVDGKEQVIAYGHDFRLDIDLPVVTLKVTAPGVVHKRQVAQASGAGEILTNINKQPAYSAAEEYIVQGLRRKMQIDKLRKGSDLAASIAQQEKRIADGKQKELTAEAQKVRDAEAVIAASEAAAAAEAEAKAAAATAEA